MVGQTSSYFQEAGLLQYAFVEQHCTHVLILSQAGGKLFTCVPQGSTLSGLAVCVQVCHCLIKTWTPSRSHASKLAIVLEHPCQNKTLHEGTTEPHGAVKLCS
jgi:hypothetical protein